MTTAVITAWSPAFNRIAELCVPSHRYLAAKLGAEFVSFSLADDEKHNWTKLALLQQCLASRSWVLWLDADCHVAPAYHLPAPVNGQKFFFPLSIERPRGYPPEPHWWHFAAWYHNDPAAFALLARAAALRPMVHDNLEDQRALNMALGERPDLREKTGALLAKGLTHFHGCPRWEKVQRLKAAVSP